MSYPLIRAIIVTLMAISPNIWAQSIATLDYQIVRTAPHNPNSFTQGWVKQGNTFYESSGGYGKSFVQRYHTNHSNTVNLPNKYFAEGLTLLNNSLYLLTWKENTLFVIDKDSLRISQRHTYQGEGWGLTHNNHDLIMSNGSATLLFRDVTDFSIKKILTVINNNPKINLRLNELEYVDGIIWANNWQEDIIYAINSHNGCMIGKLDLSKLRQNPNYRLPNNVLNGIAYDQQHNGFWVTGKYWPQRYLITLTKPSQLSDLEQQGCGT